MILPTTADTFALCVYDAPNDMRELTIDRVLALAVPETEEDDLVQSYYLEHDGWSGVSKVKCTGPHAHVVAQARQLLQLPELRYVVDDPETFGV